MKLTLNLINGENVITGQQYVNIVDKGNSNG